MPKPLRKTKRKRFEISMVKDLVLSLLLHDLVQLLRHILHRFEPRLCLQLRVLQVLPSLRPSQLELLQMLLFEDLPKSLAARFRL